MLRYQGSVMLRYFFIIFSLFWCSSGLGQQFEEKAVSGLYSDLSWIQNLTSGQAILMYTIEPNGGLPTAQLITYNDIKKRDFDFSSYTRISYFGNFKADESARYYISLVDSKFFYVEHYHPSVSDILLPPIQEQMTAKNLGTIAERARYIGLKDSLFFVAPLDFRSLLSGWILAGIGIFISIPVLYIVYRLVRGIR